MKRIIDLNEWPRKAAFDFFRGFTNPFFSLVANVKCRGAVEYCKENDISFFLYYLYQSLKSVNEISEFKLRYDENNVIEYDIVHGTPTIARPDGTFGFAYINYHPNFSKYLKDAQAEVEKVKAETGLKPATNNENVIHYSSIPWLSFTGLSHPQSFDRLDSVPKISFGKVFEQNAELLMPVSVHANHCLMDGFHVSKFFERFEELMMSVD